MWTGDPARPLQKAQGAGHPGFERWMASPGLYYLAEGLGHPPGQDCGGNLCQRIPDREQKLGPLPSVPVLPRKASFPRVVTTTMRLTQAFTRSTSTPTGRMFRNGSLRPTAVHVVALFCIGLIFSLVACRSDRRESFYATLADAKKQGAIDRGWIPDFLPESSRVIHEVHDVSPSTTWCAFEFLPRDSQGLRSNLKSVEALTPPVKRVPNPGEAWWPVALEGNLDIENIHRAGLEVYIVVGPDTPSSTEVLLFAVDWANGRGFFYRTRQ